MFPLLFLTPSPPPPPPPPPGTSRKWPCRVPVVIVKANTFGDFDTSPVSDEATLEKLNKIAFRRRDWSVSPCGNRWNHKWQRKRSALNFIKRWIFTRVYIECIVRYLETRIKARMCVCVCVSNDVRLFTVFFRVIFRSNDWWRSIFSPLIRSF